MNNATATTTAAETAREHGYDHLTLGSRLRGRAKEVGKVLVGIAEEASETGHSIEPPAVLISGVRQPSNSLATALADQIKNWLSVRR